MSRAFLRRTTSYCLGALLLTACASGPKAEQAAAQNAETQRYLDAMSAAMAPATAEERATAERSDPLTRAAFWEREYRKGSGDVEVTVAFMRALRKINSHERVRDVAQAALPIHPDHYPLFLELGRSLMADGRLEEAVNVLARASDLAPADTATPIAALGLALDRLERHAQAQDAYEMALERAPNRVSTLTNYGLSLAISGQLDAAEAKLRQAAALPQATGQVRQNLALILGLQGKYDEMILVDPNAPRRTVEANRETLRLMMVPARSYEALAAAEPYNALEVGRSAPQPMPSVAETRMEEDALMDLADIPAQADKEIGRADIDPELTPVATQGDVSEETAPPETLAGGGEATTPEVRLRPKLRGKSR
ncbi:MAG: hypothetical protein AAGF20_05865 [Pseudomonadota bacterium]